MTDTEINAAVDYANKAKLFPPKTASQSVDAITSSKAFEQWATDCISPKNIRPFPREKRDVELASLGFGREFIETRTVAAHEHIITRLRQVCAEMQRRSAKDHPNHWTYSLPEHRYLISLLKMEINIANDAADAEGVPAFEIQWEAA